MIVFNKYILWSQSFSPTEDDTIIIDGEQVKGEIRQYAFEFLSIGLNPIIEGEMHTWKKIEVNNQKCELKIKTHERTSPSLSFYLDNFQNLLLKSHYEDMDSAGRHIAFIFCIPLSLLSEAGDILNDASSIISRKCNKNDLEYINKIKLQNKQINYLYLILVITISAALWYLMKNH